MSTSTRIAADLAEGFMASRYHRALSRMGGCQVTNVGAARQTIYRRAGEPAQGR